MQTEIVIIFGISPPRRGAMYGPAPSLVVVQESIKEHIFMKAVQFAQVGGPDVLQLQEVADPVPGPEDVLI